jgi:hypothetical protein
VSYRVLLLVNHRQFVGLGLEREFGGGDWAIHARVAVGIYSALYVIGPRFIVYGNERFEFGIIGAGGYVDCSAFLDRSPICTEPEEPPGLGAGGAFEGLFRLGTSAWALGPETGYWRKFGGSGDESYGVWTLGIAVARRFRGRG